MSDPIAFYPRQHAPLLIVISGPSGVGKDAVIQRMKERNLPFHFVVTATNRPPRENEIDGKDYIFLSDAEFARMLDNDELLEHAFVYEQYKGIPRSQVRKAFDSGLDVIMRLDVQGASTIKKISEDALLIFLTPTSDEELIQRLYSRENSKDENLAMRVAMARQELKRIEEFDYVITNRQNQLDEAVDHILAIITAEHNRVKPRVVSI
jgi:guanylate kinase